MYRFRLLPFLSLGFLFNFGVIHCPSVIAEESPPKVVAQFPAEGELFKERITIIFDQTIQRDSSIPESTPWLSFSPHLAGEVEVGPNYISFHASATQTSKPRSYEVTVTNGIQSSSEQALVSRPVFHVANYIFTVKQLSLHRIDKDSTTLEIRFSDSPDIESLKSHVEVKDKNDGIVPVIIQKSQLNHSARIILPNDTALPLSIVIKSGLSSSSLHQQTRSNFSQRYPNSNNIVLRKAQWTHERNGRETISLRFLNYISSSSLDKFLIVRNPTTKEVYEHTVQTASREYQVIRVKGDIRDLDALEVVIKAGLVDNKLNGLTEPIIRTVSPEQRALRIERHYWRQQDTLKTVLHLRTNSPINPKDFEKALSIEPPVPNIHVRSGHSNYLEIEGDWLSQQAYRITLGKGLHDTSDSYQLDKELKYTLKKAPKVQGLRFTHEDKLFFPMRYRGKLGIVSRNMENVKLNIYKLLPNNLPHAMDALELIQNPSGYYQRGGNFTSEYSQFIGEQDIKIQHVLDAQVETALDMKELLPEGEHGIYALDINGRKKIVLWTNLGILSHWDDEQMVFFVHDLFSLDPIAKATVTVYSSKHQVLGTLTTDDSGLARLHSFDATLGEPKVAIIATGNDTSFLHLKPKRDTLTHTQTSLPFFTKRGYDAFLYADRDLYRPGETMRMRWIVRTHQGEAVPEVPLLLKVFNTKNQVVFDKPITLSTIGTGDIEFTTPKSFLTGAYRIELRIPGSGYVIGRHTVHLEDFIPNRMRTTIHVDDTPWIGNKKSSIRVSAEHLFGGAASGRPVETQVILRGATIRDERWESFRFRNDTIFKTAVRSLGESKTDDKGMANFSYTYTENTPATFPLEATIHAQVRELGGRAVTANLTKLLFPSDIALGVSLEKAEGDRVLRVQVAAIQADMNPASLAQVTATLERRLWHYSIRRLRGYNEPHWEQTYEVVDEKTIPLNEGRGHADFTLPNYGSFRVRVHAKETPQFSTQSFYTYGSRLNFSNATEPDLVTLTLDKKSYIPGDTAELIVESPFDGTAFILFQNSSIRDAKTVIIKDGKGVLHFPIGANDGPNLWIRTTVVHEVKDQPKETFPYSSYKTVSVPVHNVSRKLTVEFVDLPKSIRPDAPLEVHIMVNDHRGKPVKAEVTLALVDEGIHSILGYTNPDPYQWFQRPHRARLKRAHYYDQVAYNFKASPIGGDQIRKRFGSPENVEDNWVKPVALWSGIVHTDAEGHATIPFDIPDDFNGEVRLVALAVTAIATGAQAKAMKVSSPYIAKVSIPRFTRSGDTFTATLNLFNRTEEACTAIIRWKTTGAFITGKGEERVELSAMKEAHRFMQFEASNTIGSETLTWDIDLINSKGAVLETIQQTALLPVRASATFQTHHELIVLKPGEKRTLTNTRYQENDLSEATVFISALPTMQLKNPLQYIYDYPYGCVEQTTSRVFPMYMLQQVLASDPSYAYDREYVMQRIDEAVNRLFSMQTPSGGLAFWPGGNTPHTYPSVYAAHFLTLAYLDPEIQIPEESYQHLLRYLRTVAKNPGDEAGYAKLTRAYAYFVLTLSGDTDALEQIKGFDHIDMPRSGRYYLAWAKALGGTSKEDIEAYLRDAPTLPYKTSYYRNSFASDARDQSIELMTRMQIDAEDPKIHTIAASLLRQLEGAYRFNTHQTAFVSTSLGQYMARYIGDSSKAAVQVNGPKEAFVLSGTAQRTLTHKGSGGRFMVENIGESPIFLNYSTGGIPLNPSSQAQSEGISITRRIQHAGNHFVHGKTYPVRLTLTLKEPIDNIVLADLLPAGFEIENTRLDVNALVAKKGQHRTTVRPSYLEMRDDRLVLSFNKLSKGTHHFDYVVRAVTPGSFQFPAAHAEAMYNAALRGTTASSHIVIKQP